ncbi:hypothetical protein R2325_06165 [Mycobacteroides chelonae]|nr:hypothetical protein [Mycobacteroides chelonae]MEC4855301.1 hypothetical protein [Mycobacteroides chelonae]
MRDFTADAGSAAARPGEEGKRIGQNCLALSQQPQGGDVPTDTRRGESDAARAVLASAEVIEETIGVGLSPVGEAGGSVVLGPLGDDDELAKAVV